MLLRRRTQKGNGGGERISSCLSIPSKETLKRAKDQKVGEGTYAVVYRGSSVCSYARRLNLMR